MTILSKIWCEGFYKYSCSNCSSNFTSSNGFFSVQAFSRALKRLITSSKVTSIRFHDFRHTHTSILIAKGVDVVKVSKRLGHANAKITLETYAHLVPNEDNDLADIFEKALEKIA